MSLFCHLLQHTRVASVFDCSYINPLLRLRASVNETKTTYTAHIVDASADHRLSVLGLGLIDYII